MTAKQSKGIYAPDGSLYITLTDGAGNLATTGGSGLTVGTTTVTGGTNTRLLYDNSGVVGEYDASGAKTFLGLGTSATVNTGTSGATIPLLNGTNTWANAQTFTAAPAFTDQSGSRTALGLGTASTQGYTEGTWTPVLTFATPGDLSTTYSDQSGTYIKIGRQVTAFFGITLSTFTFTTASGNAHITGLPFTADNTTLMRFMGAMNWSGITKVGYTDIVSRIDGTTNYIVLAASGSASATAVVTATDMPTGGAPTLRGTVTYMATV